MGIYKFYKKSHEGVTGEKPVPYPSWLFLLGENRPVVAINPDIIIKAASLGCYYQMTVPDKLNNIITGIIKRPAWNNI